MNGVSAAVSCHEDILETLTGRFRSRLDQEVGREPAAFTKFRGQFKTAIYRVDIFYGIGRFWLARQKLYLTYLYICYLSRTEVRNIFDSTAFQCDEKNS